ncbi:3822_t:CDS:2, partial [Gigaspora margarita]
TTPSPHSISEAVETIYDSEPVEFKQGEEEIQSLSWHFKDRKSGNDCLSSISLNYIIDLSNDEIFTEWLNMLFVQKGPFYPYRHEAHDIAQQVLTHFSICLEAPFRIESNSFDLERTFAIDTTVYILNRLFRMHQYEMDVG